LRDVTEADISAWMDAGELWRFYTSARWLALRAEVLGEDLHECQECKAAGRYARATHVHHVNHVRRHPELALARNYIDGDGLVQRNLVSVCRRCHETVCHPERLRGGEPKPQINDERW